MSARLETRANAAGADSMDVTGALTSAAIAETDLLAGRWDGARVSLFAIDWSAPGTTVPLGEGTIGAVETRDGALTAELRGLSDLLERPVVEETSPECRAALGDRRCRVPMAGRRRFARAIGLAGTTITLDGVEPSVNAYGGGRLRWFDGANAGLEDAIVQSSGATVTLRRPPRFAIANALVELIEGCDKSLATCAARFGNAVNFRGEPWLPGIDLLTRYPGG